MLHVLLAIFIGALGGLLVAWASGAFSTGSTNVEETTPAWAEGFAFIEAGSFLMGSPSSEDHRHPDETPHRVTLTRDFYIQKHEVTREEWADLMGNPPPPRGPSGHGGYEEWEPREDLIGNSPVDGLTWYQAVAYANALSSEMGLDECYQLSACNRDPGRRMMCGDVIFEGLDCEGYRLPTEAEWEYAARAETTGSLPGVANDVARHNGSNGGLVLPEGGRDANLLGLHDMLGGVCEWVWDWYGDYPTSSVTDPLGPSSGPRRVLRSGSRHGYARDLRSAARYCEIDLHHGFRLARTAP